MNDYEVIGVCYILAAIASVGLQVYTGNMLYMVAVLSFIILSQIMFLRADISYSSSRKNRRVKQ